MSSIRLTISLAAMLLTACAYQPSRYIPTVDESTVKPDLYGRFLGTSTLYFTDGDNGLMVDAYLTRKSLLSNIINDIHSDREWVETFLKEKSAISILNAAVISHTHFDHALDAQSVGETYPDATIYGSEQTIQLLSNVKYKEISEPKTEFTEGNFKVTVLRSPHVEKTGSQKWVEPKLNAAMGGEAYADPGDVYSVHIAHPAASILVIPSAGYLAGYNDLEADVVFMGIGLLSNELRQPGLYNNDIDYIEEYWQKAVLDTCAKVVVPVHWDYFFSEVRDKMAVTPNWIDDIKGTMSELDKLAKSEAGCDGNPVTIAFPEGIKPFALPIIQ